MPTPAANPNMPSNPPRQAILSTEVADTSIAPAVARATNASSTTMASNNVVRPAPASLFMCLFPHPFATNRVQSLGKRDRQQTHLECLQHFRRTVYEGNTK